MMKYDLLFFLYSVSLAFILCSCGHLEEINSKNEATIIQKKMGTLETLDALAKPLIESGHNTGIIIGLVSPSGDIIKSYGMRDKKNQFTINEETLFQIGSITKVFTSHLLGIQAQEAALKIDDEIGPYLPLDFAPHNKALRKLTFKELAYNKGGFPLIHETWGLRFRALKFLFAGNNIWSNCTKDYFLDYVSGIEFPQEKPYPFQYSSLGYTFLGWVIGLTDESKDYEVLLKKKILDPLGLHNTFFDLKKEDEGRLATAYAGEYPPLMFKGSEIEAWKLHPQTRGGGGLYSSLGDLMKYLKYQMGLLKTDEKSMKAMKLSQIQMVNVEKEGIKGTSWFGGDLEKDKTAGMGWFEKSFQDRKEKIIFVKGTIAGYKAFMGFNESKNIGVVVLENNLNSSDNLGLSLIRLLSK